MITSLTPILAVGDAAACREHRGLKVCATQVCHRAELGYTRGAPKDSPEYLVASRPNRLILNLIDPDDRAYVADAAVLAALQWLEAHTPEAAVSGKTMLVHCTGGFSRSPAIALLYLARSGHFGPGPALEDALPAMRALYPFFEPGPGIAGYLAHNWDRLVVRAHALV